jgi:nucleotide-binding universal stress UspA family protein
MKAELEQREESEALRFSRIMIPVDSRETVELVIPFAKHILAPHGEIVVLNVIDASHPLEVIKKWRMSTKIATAAVEAGYRYDVNVTPEVKNSRSVVSCILDEVRKGNFDLLIFVVNPKERKKSFRFGSKSRALAKNSDCNMLILNKLTLSMHAHASRKLLVAIRSTKEGNETLRLAKTLSEEFGGLPIIQYRLPDAEAKVMSRARKAGEFRMFAKVYYGSKMASAILTELSKEKYSLLLISSDISRSRLPFYSGSTLEKLMSEAPCPVLIYSSKKK